MRPGVPWSVKGIDDQARQAAKSAARDAGLTLGQWLNSIILETADSTSGHPGAAGERTGKGKSARGAKADRSAQPNDGEIKDRLDKLADQLSSLTQQNQDTAVSRFIMPVEGTGADAGSLEAILDRIEANERRSEVALDEVNQRLQAMTDKIATAPVSGMPESPEDVPGFSALETALRNIVGHIEVSEKRTFDTLAVIQERMADISERASSAQDQGIDSNAPAIISLEQRIGDLADRLEQGKLDATQNARSYVDSNIEQLSQRIDAVRHSTDAFAEQAQSIAARSAQDQGQQIEDRLKSVIQELRASEQDSPQFTKLQGEIESLNQRFDDIKAESASERDVQALRTAIEQLTGQIGAGPDLSPIGDIERRLSEFAERLEQLPTGEGLPPQVGDLEQRVQELDTRLQQAMSAQPDGLPGNDLMTQITSVNDRLTATEQKLGALETIERSISQLFDSVEQNRVWAKEAAEEAATRMIEEMPDDQASTEAFAPSSELQALQEGLGAVKASAELSDQRNQETLEAVHDTLEQIIEKLTDLEQQSGDAPVQSVGTEPLIAPAMPTEPEPLQAGDPAVPPSDLPIMTPPAAPDTEAPVGAEPQSPMPGSPIDEQFLTASEALQPAMPDLASEHDFVTPPADPPPAPDVDREDFIAAARRAAQNASSQSRISVLGGLNLSPQRANKPESHAEADEAKSGSKFSLAFLRRNKAANDEPESIIPSGAINGTPEDEDEKAKNGKRRQLILAGLILLAAVSAYSLGGIGKKGVLPKSAPATTGDVGQSQSLEQLQNSLSQVQKKVSKAAETGLETVPLGSEVRIQSAMSATTGMTSVAKVAEPAKSEPAIAAASSLGTSSQIATASLTPPTGETSKFDQEDESPLGVRATSTISEPAAPPSVPAANSSTISPVSAANATVAPQADLLPGGIGSASLRQAATAGQSNAQYVIGTRFLDGKVVKQDFKQAAEWYRKAAAQGLAPAQYRLGTLFERGRGMPKDMTAARLWYERAAERKNVKSMHNLAVIYANNETSTAQFDKAAKWFLAAAEHGLRDSAYNLAVLHERGLGVPQDQTKAYFWFGIAARLQDADAATKVARMKKLVKPADLARLDKEIEAWRPKKPDNAGNLVAITDPTWKVGGRQTATQPPPAPASTPDQISDGDLILVAQQMLSSMGFDVGPMDGVMGSRTANAVRLFQLQTGQTVNGTVSRDLISMLQARRG